MADPFSSFEPFDIRVSSSLLPASENITIHGVRAGSGPPLLLLHGNPETHYMWHNVAAPLSKHFTVVCTDLRGYGASSKPAFEGDKSHAGYSKREMAKDNVEVMSRLGFSKFFVCAHDRGARVTHRMLLDYADVVEKAILLDIAPTLTMYEDTNLEFATAYYHWFFLIQPAPFPELLLSTNPSAYLYRSFAREGEPGPSNPALKKFSKAALDRYEAAISSPGTIHAICEDYRASATIDLVYDREDRSRGKKIKTPLKVFWGGKGIIGKLWEPLRAWEAVSEPGYVKGGREITQSGHFIPEEAPDDIMAEILHFFMEK